MPASIWYKNPGVLFENPLLFLPNRNMTTVQALNASFKLSLYISIILFCLQKHEKGLFVLVVGALLTGVFASTGLGGFEDISIGSQVWVQFVSIIATAAYSGIASLILLKGIDIIIGLRVEEDQEVTGLDVTMHNERGYDF